MKFWLRSPLFEEAGEGNGGGGQPAAGAPPPAADDVAALKAQIVALQTEKDTAEQTAQFWAEKAKAPAPAAAAPVKAKDKENEDTIFEALAKEGDEALTKRGFVRMEDVEKVVNTKLAEGRAKDQTDTFDAKLKTDFPELANPKSELTILAQKHFREAIALDPSAESSRGTMYTAAKLAKQELEMKNPPTGNKQQDRRERIGSQSGDRAPAGGDQDPGEISSDTKQVISHLAAFGVTEKSFRENIGGVNGRG